MCWCVAQLDFDQVYGHEPPEEPRAVCWCVARCDRDPVSRYQLLHDRDPEYRSFVPYGRDPGHARASVRRCGDWMTRLDSVEPDCAGPAVWSWYAHGLRVLVPPVDASAAGALNSAWPSGRFGRPVVIGSVRERVPLSRNPQSPASRSARYDRRTFVETFLVKSSSFPLLSCRELVCHGSKHKTTVAVEASRSGANPRATHAFSTTTWRGQRASCRNRYNPPREPSLDLRPWRGL